MSNLAVTEELKIKVGNYNINYVKVGTGPHTVLCWPGTVGSIWTDFKPQIEGFDRDRFTLIVLDPPGYGKSRPPEREFVKDMFINDAEYSYEFMKALGIPRFSFLGWSDGGIVGLIAAAKYPDAIQKLVVWGSYCFVTPQQLEVMKTVKGTEGMSEKMLKPLREVYGEDTLTELWQKMMIGKTKLLEENNNNVCRDLLKDIVCPTFILHGEKDPVISPSQARYMNENIRNSVAHYYEAGKHNIHLRYAEDFNRRVQEFLLLPAKSSL